MPVMPEQRPDVGDDQEMPEEETQLDSLPGFVIVAKKPKPEEFEG